MNNNRTQSSQSNRPTRLFLPNKIIHSKELSQHAIVAYCALQVFYTLLHTERLCVTPYELYYFLTQNEEPTTHTLTSMKQGLEELIEQQIITEISISHKHYILDCSKLHLDTHSERFTVVYLDEILKILRLNAAVNNFTLLRYFVNLISTISPNFWLLSCPYDVKNNFAGCMTEEELAKLSGISTQSVIDYNKILEEHGMIYVHRQNSFSFGGKKQIRQLPNVYGRLCDKDDIEQLAANQRKDGRSHYYGNRDKNDEQKALANEKRKLAQIYNQIVDGNADGYTHKELQTVYNYICSRNEAHRQEGNTKKICDVSMLERLLCISKDEA